MKRLISLIAVVALLVTMVPVTFGFEIENWQTFYTPYDDDTPHGLLPANYFADAVMKYHSVGGWDDETEDAESSGPGSGDVTVGQSEGSILYVGFEEKFDGFVLDMSTPAEYGSYVVEYWSSNGSGEWIEIVEEPVWWDSDLVNDVTTGESFSLTWDDRPSDWVEVEVNGSDAYYYVRLRITADYYNIAYANNAAIIDYNLMIELFNELDEPVTGLEANTIPGFFFVTAERSQTDADGYIYDFNDDEEDEGTYYLALHAPIGAEPEYDYSISAEGYVTIQGVDVNLGKDRDGWFFDDTSGMQYSHVLNVVNSVGGALDIESADVGSSSLDCDINDGLAYCAVPYGEDGSTSYAYTYIDGHVMGQTSLPDRDYYTDAQEETEVEMLVAYLATVDNEDGDGVTGATVTAGDSYGTECIEIGSGDYGCPVPLADTSAGIMVVADGYEEFTGEFSYERTWHDDDQVADTFVLEDNDSDDDGLTNDEEATLGTDPDDDDSDDDGLLDGEEVNTYSTDPLDDDSDDGGITDGNEVTNGTDPNDASDDDTDDGTDSDGDGLSDEEEVTYGTDDADADTDNDGLSDGEEVNVYTTEALIADTDGGGENDGDEVDGGRDPLDSSDDDVEDADTDGDGLTDDEEENAYYTDPNDSDSDDDGLTDYDEVMDYETDPNELDTDGDGVYDGTEVATGTDPLDEDDYLADAPDYGQACSDPFVDTTGHWAGTAICILYNAGAVSGRSYSYFYPNEEITRAEFLKVMLLNRGEDVDDYDDVSYSDVSAESWYYPYVAYATNEGYVEGYDDGTFKPNDYINRAEAVVMTMRIYDEELWGYTSGDIEFSDVDTDDWFAYAVILASQNHIVEGYSDGEFKPEENITRAEVAVIARRSYYAFDYEE